MTPTVEAPTFAAPVSQAPRSAGERALDHFLAAGFERTEPPVLHPAAIFLDMSGEEVRRRLFLTAGAAGEELCSAGKKNGNEAQAKIAFTLPREKGCAPAPALLKGGAQDF